MSDPQDVMPADAARVSSQWSLGYAIHLALGALSLESAQWTALILSFALFAFAIVWPTPLRLATAATFTLTACLFVWLRKDRR